MLSKQEIERECKRCYSDYNDRTLPNDDRVEAMNKHKVLMWVLQD